jgi:multicomponent K+:H+ antiporter subunit F
MSANALPFLIIASQILLVAAMSCAGVRIMLGPRAQDRIAGFDALSTSAMLLILTFGIRFRTTLYFEAALIVALLGFVGTLAFAKFLLRGEVIE